MVFRELTERTSIDEKIRKVRFTTHKRFDCKITEKNIISIGKVTGGTAPILADGFEAYSNPLPHVLILTAIVVGVATTAMALALIVRIKEAYGTIEEDEIRERDVEPEA